MELYGGGLAGPCDLMATDWPEMQGTTSLPLELDPLPPLFPFTPPPLHPTSRYEGGQDVADVLLSLKHAVVHPPSPPPPYSPPPPPPQSTYHTPQLSCGYGGMGGTGGDPNGGYMFPSMSVNVSMTMHPPCYPPPHQELATLQPCAQMNWTTSSSPPLYQTSNGMMSPQYQVPTASYSFTADLRPHVQPPPPPPPDPYQQEHYILPECSPSSLNKKRSPSPQMSTSPNGTPNRPNLCRICGKTYARPSTLKTHLRTHSGERPYRCDDCNKSFSQAANLTAHVRTHSGEKPFRCPICARRFSQSSSVTTHMRTHSGERPYRCRLCKKAFSDSSTLTKHLRIHSGEKPYQCKLCLLRFSQSGNLNRHMRVHSGNGLGPMSS